MNSRQKFEFAAVLVVTIAFWCVDLGDEKAISVIRWMMTGYVTLVLSVFVFLRWAGRDIDP